MSDHLFELIIAITPATVAGIMAVINSRINSAQIQKARAEVREIQITINGRITELLAATARAATATTTTTAAVAAAVAAPDAAGVVVPAIAAALPAPPDHTTAQGETK